MSNENRFFLPGIDELRKASQGLALADAILMRDWELRYFSFNREWNPDTGESMGSMRNGSGSEYFVLFSRWGVAGKVFDNTEPNRADNLLYAIPESFETFKGEVAFSLESATQFFWRHTKDGHWSAAPETPQSRLLEPLRLGLDFYHPWAEEYYERTVDRAALAEIFNSLSVTADQLHRLNPEVSITEIRGDITEIVGS